MGGVVGRDGPWRAARPTRLPVGKGMVVGGLKDGVSLDEAKLGFAIIAQRSKGEFPERDSRWSPRIVEKGLPKNHVTHLPGLL